MNIKKIICILLSFIFLTSCKKVDNACYQCYYGKEVPLSISLPYEKINQKEVQNNILDLKLDSPLYFNQYLIENEEDINSFFSTVDLTYKDSDYEMISFDNHKEAKMIFILQIPKGYSINREENIQEKEDDEEIFITPNFYYYQTRKNISYFTVNLKKDEYQKDFTVYTTVLLLRDKFKDNLTSSSTRVIYKE